MAEDDYRRIFTQKLAYYMNLHNKNQTDLMRDLNLSSATVSSWCTGKKLPRMNKIQMLADYFNIEKSDLIEEKNDTDKSNDIYYLNDDAREMAQFMFDNPEYKVLFDASRNVKKEDIELVKQLIDRFKE